jgi:hypothetical protein
MTEINPTDNSATDSDPIISSLPDRLYFSTEGNVAIPGVPGPNDDADIYSWNGTSYSRIFDASANGVPAGADVDALKVVDNDTFYLSFNTEPVVIPGVGGVSDEDIVLYDAGTWSIFFDGSDVSLTTFGEDVDAFEILPDGSVLISTLGFVSVPGIVTPVPTWHDLLRCAGTFGPATSCTWSMYFDASDVGLGVFPPLGALVFENVDGASVTSNGTIYLSTIGDFAVPALTGLNEDVFACNAPTTGPATACTGGFSLHYDGSANGITNNLDAIDLPDSFTGLMMTGINSNSDPNKVVASP